MNVMNAQDKEGRVSRPANRTTMSKYANPDHKRVARTLGYVLTLGTTAAWHGLAIVLMARLTDEERVALAYAALMALSDEHASAVAEVAA